MVHIGGVPYGVTISSDTFEKLISDVALDNSDYPNGHYAVLHGLLAVIEGSIDAEITPNVKKRVISGGHRARVWKSSKDIDRNLLVHRLYAAVEIGESDYYRVMVLIKEGRPDNSRSKKIPYVFEVKDVELLNDSLASTKQGQQLSDAFKSSTIPAANLLNGIEKPIGMRG